MKKNNWLIGSLLMFVFAFSFVACEETKDEGEYYDWKERNDTYIKSIADTAALNADTNWKVLKAWNLPPDGSTDLGASFNVQNYVYVHVKKKGAGTVSPFYTDSVSVSYRGKLINGDIFEEPFISNELKPETAGRTTLYLNKSVVGMTTALQDMHVGDLWEVYIPWNLAYGSSASGSIPKYSDLIFELYLAEINPLKKKTD